MNNVIPISRAKSFVAPAEDRYVDSAACMHYFSLSKAALKNYAQGYYHKGGKQIPYPKGPMPHVKTPGGKFRFNLAQCAAWLGIEDTPVE